MSSSHPLFRRFENEVTVGGRKFEWAMRGRDFCFRPLSSDLSVVWCQLARRDMPEAFEQPATLERVVRRLARDLEHKQFWRFWPWDEEKELVFNGQFALFRHKDDDFWLRLEWSEPKDDRMLYLPDVSSVKTELEPIDELVALAQSIRQSGQFNWFVCARGEMKELERVLNACMKLSGFYIHYFGKGNLDFGSLLHAPYDASSEQWDQLRRVQEILNRHFELKWSPVAARFYNHEGRKERRPHIYVRCPLALSQHERLEALLVWRQFLCDKVSLEEVEALLPKF